MKREHIACAYPGTQKIGLSLWIVDDGTITACAVGSVEHAQVAGVLDRFRPDLLVVEGGRTTQRPAAPFRTHAKRLRFAHPGWRARSLAQPLGRIGELAQNAWRIGWHELVRRGSYRVGRLDYRPLDAEWLAAHAPWRSP